MRHGQRLSVHTPNRHAEEIDARRREPSGERSNA
jgi:hypothetical protein